MTTGIPFTDIIVGTGTALSAAAAWWSVQHNRHSRDRAQDKIERQGEISEAIHPLDRRLSTVEQLMKALPAQIDIAIDRAMDPLRTDIGVLKTQVEVFWRSVALDAAKILHQPDPARRHIDVLLEELMEGTLTVSEEVELRKLLVTIRNWEPGQDVGFPVRDGEQGQAALLLRTMEYIPQRRNYQ